MERLRDKDTGGSACVLTMCISCHVGMCGDSQKYHLGCGAWGWPLSPPDPDFVAWASDSGILHARASSPGMTNTCHPSSPHQQAAGTPHFPLSLLLRLFSSLRRLNQGGIKSERSGRSASPGESTWQERSPRTWNLITRRSWRNSLVPPPSFCKEPDTQ